MPRIVLERSLKGKEKSLLDTAFPQGRLAVVFDPQTYDALGRRVIDAMQAARVTEILLPAHPSPDDHLLKTIRMQSKACAALVAIGSGTINDLCKRAAFLDSKPYGVFATAPSMNGYVSANASLYTSSQGGAQKESFPAAAPSYVFADLEVLASAPLRLIRSGLGDSLCRATAQADWLLSHFLLQTPYDARPFEMLADIEKELFSSSATLVQGDIRAIELLMRTLLLSGEGMTLAGGSYPASQGEHMIAHSYELLSHMCAKPHSPSAADLYHGEIIAVTTLEMASLQSHMLENFSPRFKSISAFEDKKLQALFGPATESYKHAFSFKLDRVEANLSLMAARWREAKSPLAEVTHSSEFLKDVMEAAGAATTPAQLGMDDDLYRAARKYAFYIRDRFTFLDLEVMVE